MSITANGLRALAALRDAAGRRAAGAFLVEGRRAIDALLAAGWQPRALLVRAEEPVPTHWPVVETVTARALERVSAASTPSGYLAVFPIPEPPPLDPSRGGLVLAGISDPGNFGTLVRSAAAFGVVDVVCLGGADPWGPKAVQASAGALGVVRLHRSEVLPGGAPACALVPRGGLPPERLAPGPRWLVVGAEADGIPEPVLAACTERLTLPMPGGQVESLNAAVAGSVALYALARGPV